MNIAIKLAESCARYAGRVAISEGNRQLTYTRLFHHAVQVANWLEESGTRNAFIAVEIENTIDHVLAMLGILLSGNAYLSVTPENKALLAGAGFPVAMHIVDAPAGQSIQGVALGDILRNASAREKVRNNDVVHPTAPMCAFLTSGSTGKSKIVVHTHQTILADTLRQIESNSICHTDKLDLVFSLSFSASLACIYPALLTGAELAVFNLKKNGLRQLADFWQEKQISFSTLSVSSFRGVAQVQSTFKYLHALRFISISAEPVKDTIISLFRSKFPTSAVLQVAYASTETRTISELKIYNDGRPEAFTASIGKPVKDKQVYIADPGGIPLPVNTIGEITVASKYIATGYYGTQGNREGFEKRGDLIHYRTGDLGYMNGEGYLFYKGRITHECKLNGIKINVAEIERAVEQVPGIAMAAVVICGATATQPKLTCFFTLHNTGEEQVYDQTRLKDALKAELSRKLPATHLPRFFMLLDQMPLTHTGKIDRKALEKIDPLIHPDSTTSNTGIGTTVSVILEIFKSILRNSKVGPDSDFFDHGGDSLSALQCITEIESALQVKLKGFVLVAHNTPRKLAEYIETIECPTPSLVETKILNGFIESRKNLYILHHLQDRVFDPLIAGKLSTHFNLVMCYYDLKNLAATPNGASLLVDDFTRILGADEKPVVLGYSISGYVAHQLACILPRVTCIMIDSFNYFELDRYREEKAITARLKNFFWQVVVNRDLAYPWYLLYSKYEWVAKNKRVWKSPEFFEGVRYLATHLTHQAAHHHGIYFQATRRHRNHGTSWRSYFTDKFSYITLKCDHHTILEKHSTEIAERVLQLI